MLEACKDIGKSEKLTLRIVPFFSIVACAFNAPMNQVAYFDAAVRFGNITVEGPVGFEDVEPLIAFI